MKKIILMILFTIANVSCIINASEFENSNSKLYLKRAACVTAGVISAATFVPALISDLNAQPGTAQAEVPLCILPLMVILLSGISYE